jgi:hypothetical protein
MASPNAHIGALYAFSALVAQVSICRALLPFGNIAILDLSRPDIQLSGAHSSFQLRLAPGPVASTAYVTLPKWISLCPPQLTSLHLSQAVIDAACIRGLYHNIPGLKEISLHGCAINLAVESSPPCAWHSLWNTAKEVGHCLRTVDIGACTYLGSATVQLDALLEADAQSLENLKHHLRSLGRD